MCGQKNYADEGLAKYGGRRQLLGVRRWVLGVREQWNKEQSGHRWRKWVRTWVARFLSNS